MQYVRELGDDLKSGYTTYVLQNSSMRDIAFFAYTGDTATKADKQSQEHNKHLSRHFLRKGFSDAIMDADPNVVVPVYKDNEDNDVFPKSKDEALSLIFGGKINVSGFTFIEEATDAQKEEALGKLINNFVSTSQNLDFGADKNLFVVQNNFHQVIYNNGGKESVKIKGVDVQEKVGLNTKEVATNKVHRQRMMQSRLRNG